MFILSTSWKANVVAALALVTATGAAARGAGFPSTAPAVGARAPDPVALVARGECGRCHAVEGLGLVRAPRARSCAGCHQWIHDSPADPDATAEGRRHYPRWDRYVTNVASFLDVPDLTLSAARLRADFVAAYLRAPFQVRPALGESMFRAPFSEDEAAALAAWLTTEARRRAPGSAEARAAAAIAPSTAASDVKQGAALFASLGCSVCHARAAQSGAPSLRPQPSSPVRGAPDLAFVARRLTPADLAGFIADPAAYGAETKMPKYPLTAQQAARLRDYLWAEAGAPASAGPTHDSAPLLRAAPGVGAVVRWPATYAEVRARVLDAVCIHCHMDPAKNKGEGGPGNTGGLGYRGAALDLESWLGIQRGARDDHGQRRSILERPADGGEPLLLRRLRRRAVERRAERAGQPLPAAPEPGMPLGLPPLGDAELDLVARWLKAGAPGPDGRPARATHRAALGVSRFSRTGGSRPSARARRWREYVSCG